VSEEQPSADSDLVPAATAIESSDAAPEALSVPRQSPGPAVESDGTVDALEAPAPIETAAAVETEAPVVTAEPATAVDLAFAGSTAAPTAVPSPAPAPATPAPATLVPATPVPATPVPAMPVPAESTAPPRRKRRVLASVIFGLLVVVLLAAIGWVVYQRLYADPTRNAVAGNCLADLPVVAVGEDREVTSARVVDCGDASATHIVEARINNKTEAEAKSQEVCKAFPDTTFIYRAVPQGGTGYVLCLKRVDE
jgi:hypothetical protein